MTPAVIAMLAAACWTIGVGTGRHPLHTTITELTFEPRSRAAAIVMRAFEDDLAAAAATSAEAGLVAYVSRHFLMSDRAGRPIAITWEHVRRANALLWVSGRVTLADGLDGANVLNRVLTERYEDQVNVVQATDGTRRRTVLFTRGDGAKALR